MGIAQNWRLRSQLYALVGEACDGCGKKIFPPRDVCPFCAQEPHTPFKFSERGELFSNIIIYNRTGGCEATAESACLPTLSLRIAPASFRTERSGVAKGH